MSFTIASIKWPENNRDAIRLYLAYVIKVLDYLNIRFADCDHDPLELARSYISNKISSEKYEAETLAWWKKIDSQNAIREFQNENILMARLAICLLPVKEDSALSLGDDLSWFIEVLGFMGADIDSAIDIMIEHFSQEKSKDLKL